ncbi:GNAT family N-acetyltransferase [Pantoea ananatis]|uniref:GNAT family N-acetyltransferase n=1 Tax=Pantoea ananas TaxID=553 RepID=UPI0011AA81F8|nr:GNAT family N-acetyltransferase [Pantoea ananatis]
MLEVTIEEWQEQYRQDFISLSLDWLEKYVSVEPIDLEMLNNHEEHIFSRHGRVFFARLNNETVGTVAMISRGDRVMELAKLAVAEKFRGDRIGQRLMEHCIDFAKTRNADKIILFTADVLVPAVKLYRRFSFIDVALTDNQYAEADMRMELTF